jgi:hypothetical protein
MFTGKGSMQVEADPDTLGAILLLAMGAEAIAADPANPSPLAVSTTLSQAQPIGAGWATPASMTNILKGQSLTVDTSTPQETVIVRAVTATQFFAYFSKAHAASVTVVNASSSTPTITPSPWRRRVTRSRTNTRKLSRDDPAIAHGGLSTHVHRHFRDNWPGRV